MEKPNLHCQSASRVADIGTGQCQGVPTPCHQLPHEGVVRDPDAHEGGARVQLGVQMLRPLKDGGDRPGKELLKELQTHSSSCPAADKNKGQGTHQVWTVKIVIAAGSRASTHGCLTL